MKNNKKSQRIQNNVIAIRLLVISTLTVFFARLDFIAASSWTSKYIIAIVLAVLVTAVLAEKHIQKFAVRLADSSAKK